MRAPKVYGAINAVAAALSKDGIPKRRNNEREGYPYRGIDDLYNRLSPLLAEHKLCILPRVLERTATERIGTGGELLVNVAVRAAFDLVSVKDGSTHVIEAYGEALDGGDKATAKAMGSAYKYALFQALCVPVGSDDADASTHKLVHDTRATEPVQGWEQWAADIAEMLRVCQTSDAIDRVQSSQRPLLLAIALERPELYVRLGAGIRDRRAALAKPVATEGTVAARQEGNGAGRPKRRAMTPPVATTKPGLTASKDRGAVDKLRTTTRKTKLNGSGVGVASRSPSPGMSPDA